MFAKITFYKSLIVMLLFIFSLFAQSSDDIPTLDAHQLRSIGKKIYQNETGSNPAYLVAWNAGESFASLGLGHFIWFPEGINSPFTETFPALLDYIQQQGVMLPSWLQARRYCPWSDKQSFQQAQSSAQMAELRALLASTFEHQVNFIYQRMRNALPAMLKNVSSKQEEALVVARFHQLANNELGMYALIDYVNFKGEGISKTEKYEGEGWGLLQVLLNIDEDTESINAAFRHACEYVLTRRVENSPQKDVEQRWLQGWKKRCGTYEN